MTIKIVLVVDDVFHDDLNGVDDQNNEDYENDDEDDDDDND